MTDREIFEKETGIKEPKLYYVNDDNGLFARAQIAEYWKSYSEWLGKRSEWVSVGDRLPENGQEVFVSIYAGTKNEYTELAIFNNGKFDEPYYGQDVGGYITGVTHWMVKPTPPDEAKRGRG